MNSISTSVHEEIRAFCVAHSDERIVEKYARFFREGYDAYGVDRDSIAECTRAILTRYRDELGLDGFLDLGDSLMQSGKWEEAGFAVRFMSAFRKKFTPATLPRFRRWFDLWVRDWATSDGLCSGVLPRFFDMPEVGLDGFATWRGSESKWSRRAAPVAMLSLLKRCDDVGAFLEFIRPLMLDEERVVHQGLGWFLREAWKVRSDQVQPFLMEWKETSARLIFQYATEKMASESRACFRREGKSRCL
ncbi:MAG: DNA alkylation repair protein [Clostridia bacterium]|nr:DNA alkylation repair protein [Clostridia bacterium]